MYRYVTTEYSAPEIFLGPIKPSGLSNHVIKSPFSLISSISVGSLRGAFFRLILWLNHERQLNRPLGFPRSGNGPSKMSPNPRLFQSPIPRLHCKSISKRGKNNMVDVSVNGNVNGCRTKVRGTIRQQRHRTPFGLKIGPPERGGGGLLTFINSRGSTIASWNKEIPMKHSEVRGSLVNDLKICAIRSRPA